MANGVLPDNGALRIVVTGANGQVGWELVRSLLPLGEVIALDRSQADLSVPDALGSLMDTLRPNVVINAAAYTAVDKAEQEQDLAMRVNGLAVGALAEAARRNRALFIHYSTDYVFDGSSPAPYQEQDAPNPLNVYGRSKLLGEQATKAAGGDYLVLRTSWVYAARGQNFLNTMLRLSGEREELRIVADQIGAPTWARTIADTTAQIVAQAMTERRQGHFVSGILHLSAAGETSWYEFASRIVERARLSATEPVITRHIVPISTEDYPLPAARPKNSRLSCTLLQQRYGLTLPSWETQLYLCLADRLGK